MRSQLLNISGNNQYSDIGSTETISVAEKLNKLLIDKSQEIELPAVWNINSSIDCEVKKSVLRSQLRYSSFGSDLADQVYRNFTAHKPSKGLRFYTRIYPIIHLPKDRSELGELHSDQIGKNQLFTAWTPVTEYQYPALSCKDYGLLKKYFNKKLKRNVFDLENNKRNIHVSLGKTLAWSAGFFHEGNLNTSQEFSSAAVIRITQEPLEYEPTRTTDGKEQSLPIMQKPSPLSLTGEYELLWACIKFCQRFEEAEFNLESLHSCNNFFKETLCLDQNLSFSLALVSQRIKTSYQNFNSNVFSIDESAYLGLAALSLLCGAENLIAMEYLLGHFSGIGQERQLVDFFGAELCDYDCTQSRYWKNLLNQEVATAQLWRF